MPIFERTEIKGKPGLVTNIIRLTHKQVSDLNKGIPVYIHAGENLMSEILYTKIITKGSK